MIPEEENPLYLNSKKDFKPNNNDDYGYFFYPERFGNVYKPKWHENFISIQQRENLFYFFSFFIVDKLIF